MDLVYSLFINILFSYILGWGEPPDDEYTFYYN